MNAKLKATITKETPKSIHLEISKETFETFCDAAGLYRKEFIKLLDLSEEDHKRGRVTKRESLSELLKNEQMEISTTATFDKLFKDLPKFIQKKAVRKTEPFKNNPFHPTLRIEKLHPKGHQVWSFRVDISYRIVFKLIEANYAELRFIGHHNQIYNYDIFK